MKTNIIVKLQIEGIHNWPEASEIAGEEVSYLNVLHRHIFYITCKKEVFHDNRDIEFIMFKHEIEQFIYDEYFEYEKKLHVFNSKSCEMIAREILDNFELNYCSVFEDNENGAEIIN